MAFPKIVRVVDSEVHKSKTGASKSWDVVFIASDGNRYRAARVEAELAPNANKLTAIASQNLDFFWTKWVRLEDIEP